MFLRNLYVQLREWFAWVLRPEVLSEQSDSRGKQKRCSFLRWIFSHEDLDQKDIVQKKERSTLRWIFSAESLEEKPVVDVQRRNILRWIIEKEELK